MASWESLPIADCVIGSRSLALPVYFTWPFKLTSRVLYPFTVALGVTAHRGQQRIRSLELPVYYLSI
ncbi:MAG: hypothetical protein U0V45_05125 [Flavobacteriales bacterium]